MPLSSIVLIVDTKPDGRVFILSPGLKIPLSILPAKHKNQIDWLTSSDGELLMDYVYKVEDFEKAIKIIRDKTNNKINLSNVKYNSNPISKSSEYREMYNYETRKLIEKRFEKDIDYFKYKF